MRFWAGSHDFEAGDVVFDWELRFLAGRCDFRTRNCDFQAGDAIPGTGDLVSGPGDATSERALRVLTPEL